MKIRALHILIPFFLFTVWTGNAQKSSAMEVYGLNVEYLFNPLGIDRQQPNFGWKLKSEFNGDMQSAYQVKVFKETEKLDQALVWDSGKQYSSNSLNIDFQGKPLKSSTGYFWKVKVWDANNTPSKWSTTAFFQTGILEREDWKAKWISNKFSEVSEKREAFSKYDDTREFVSEDTAAVYLRKKFNLRKKVKKAMVYISGLGYYELFLNGTKIGNHVLDPVFTDYQKTIKYLAYDVTKVLKKSENTIGILLGNGFYNHQEPDLFQMEKANWKTPPKLLFQLHLELTDGSVEHILSDPSWKWSYGPLVYNSIRGGETIDARIDFSDWTLNRFDDANWENAVLVPAPPGKLSYQYMPPLRETKNFDPVKTWQVGKDTTLFDFGENITGYADLEISGKAGTEASIYFNEVLNHDSTLDIKNSSGHTWGRFQKGKLILSKNNSDHYRPRFTYHGFKYVQVTGVPEDSIHSIKAHSVHTDLKSIGKFKSSSERLNDLHAAVRRTLLNSVHSMPGEEPTREKMGWTFDAGMVTMDSYLMNFDAINTYKKYLNDLIDAQEESGHVPPIVPTNGWGFLANGVQQRDTIIRFDDPWWGGTIAYVADKLYKYTRDTTILGQSFEPIKRYTDFVMSTAEKDIVYWSLGDWLDLKHNQNGWGPGLTPIEQTSTAASFYLCDIVAKHAEILGKTALQNEYRNHAERIKKAFNTKYLDKETGWYAENSQTAQALPLFLGMVPQNTIKQVEARLLDAIKRNDYHTSVGFIGVIPMLRYLSENGHRDIVFEMLMQEESPGWLHFVNNEKSTMGENLNASGYGTSHHPFAANIGFYLYHYLGGIEPDLTGTSDFILTPGIDTSLEWANTSYISLKGPVKVYWEKTDEDYIIIINLPPNSSGFLRIPTNFEIPYHNQKFQINRLKNWIILKIPSGHHSIQIKRTLNK